jgi:hypothetical protein
MNREKQKAMWARINSQRQNQVTKFDKFRQGKRDEQLKQEFGSHLKEDMQVTDRMQQLHGKRLRLAKAVSDNDYMDPTHVWSFKAGQRFHPTDDDGDYGEFPLEERDVTIFFDRHGQRHELKEPDKRYFVNNTEVNPKYIRQIAKFAKEKGLLQTGSLQELQMKAVFDASNAKIKPVAIKLGNNTFFIAPVATGND